MLFISLQLHTKPIFRLVFECSAQYFQNKEAALLLFGARYHIQLKVITFCKPMEMFHENVLAFRMFVLQTPSRQLFARERHH